MYIVLIAWTYVAVLMAVAEAAAPNGTLLGAVVTLLFYGVLPVTLIAYLMGTPSRRRARLRRTAEDDASVAPIEPDAGGHPATSAQPNAVAAVRKEA